MDDLSGGRLPVIYVRGYAGGPSGISAAVDDPFYGFNEGSVQVRVDDTDRPAFHQFESPLLRLMIDHGYQLLVQGNQRGYLDQRDDGTIDAASIWVHRFYDEFAPQLTRDPNPFSIERAAQSLFDLIRLVRRKTGAPRVFLVAHSMGGLVVRAMLQKTIPDATDGRPDAATDFVDRVFTYATPHGGIEFSMGFGALEKLRDLTGVAGADIFGPDRMYRYLTPQASALATVPKLGRDRDARGRLPRRPYLLPGGNQLERLRSRARAGQPCRRCPQRRAGPGGERVREGRTPGTRAPQPLGPVRHRELRGGVPEPAAVPVR